MRMGQVLLIAAGLCCPAAHSAEPEKVPELPKPPAKTSPLVRIPGQTITVRPGDTTAAISTTGVCSVPLLNVLRPGPQISRMPIQKPAPSGFATREVPLPAPPCEERKP